MTRQRYLRQLAGASTIPPATRTDTRLRHPLRKLEGNHPCVLCLCWDLNLISHGSPPRHNTDHALGHAKPRK